MCASLPFLTFQMAPFKGSTVLLICQKKKKSRKPITFSVPDMLVIFIGAICVVTEWITERCHPQSTPEGALKVREGPCPWRCSGVGPWQELPLPVLRTHQREPHWSQLWGDCLALHYLESLKFFCSLKEKRGKDVF